MTAQNVNLSNIKYDHFLNAVIKAANINGEIYQRLIYSDDYNVTIQNGTYKDILNSEEFVNLPFDELLIIKDILDLNLKRLGLRHNINLTQSIEQEFIKSFKRAMNKLSFKYPELYTNRRENQSLSDKVIFEGLINNGAYIICGAAHAGKQLVNNYFIAKSIKSGQKPLHISCGERRDVLFRDKKNEFIISDEIFKNTLEMNVVDDIVELISSLITTRPKVCLINSLNTIITNAQKGMAAKGGIDKGNIENIILLLNTIAESLGIILFITMRVTDSEVTNGILDIINGVSWGYFYVNHNDVLYLNRFSLSKEKLISKRVIINDLPEIKPRLEE